MTFDEFQSNVQQWASDRGIYAHSTVHAQVLKTVSEMGELADATIKDDDFEFVDSVGDILVCLVNACHMKGVDINDCIDSAWTAIKDRKGHMVPGGAFVKDEALCDT